MRVLIVCSGNRTTSPFIVEQAESLRNEGVQIEFFKIKGKGIFGYLRNRPTLIKTLRRGNFDLIHAHYGLSGLLATLQRNVPVIITYHGSDVNRKRNLFFSMMASRLAQYNILVNREMVKQLYLKKRFNVIPCGVDFSTFFSIDKKKARKKLGFDPEKKYLVFSSAFDNPVKNYPLAKAAIARLEIPVELIELKNRARHEVNLLFNASDLLLITSHTEGSPQVAKEALACNTPVVSTGVGDVKQLIFGLKNCYIVQNNPEEIAEKIHQVLASDRRYDSRKTVELLELQNIARSLINVYLDLLNRKGIKDRTIKTDASQNK